MSPVTAIVFAATPGEGFRSPRWLEEFGQATLIESVVATSRKWGCDALVLVLGSDADIIVESVELDADVVVIDPGWEEGEASSVRVGLDAAMRLGLTGDAVLSFGEYPLVAAEVPAALLARHNPEIAPVTVPKYRYARGVPYVVAEALWPRLLGIEGDSRLESLWLAHSEWVTEVWLDRLPPRPAKTPLDLDEMRIH